MLNMDIEQLTNQVKKNVEVIKELQKQGNQTMSRVNDQNKNIERLNNGLTQASREHQALRQEIIQLIIKAQKEDLQRIKAIEDYIALPWYKKLFKSFKIK